MAGSVSRGASLLALACGWVAAGALLARADALPVSDQRYALDVELDVRAHVVTGHGRIHFTNHSRAPLSDLYFHLYPNAFRDHKSVFMREQGERVRGGVLGRPGRLDVTRLVDAAGHDLLAGAERELIANDFTQLRVRLPAPLPPMAALDLELAFRTQLPEIVARAGYAQEFHMLGQWFPKLARLEPDGTFRSFPYHGLGEFYADFADYAVQVRLPVAYQVAASGLRVSIEADGSRRTEHYVANHVHDFAWAAYPYFITRVQRIGDVTLQLYAPAGHEAALERQARVLAAALPYFEQRYGTYPYPKLSVVIPPLIAERASGMEYPTLFLSAGPFWALPAWAPDPGHDVVAVHELAHQWFCGMLASDEVRYPMLDEGLAEWSSLDFLRHFYRGPGSMFAERRPPFELFDLVRAIFVWRGAPMPSSLLPITSYRYATLARAVYMRPGLVFESIAERFGSRRLQAALATYARAQRFEHPTPRELFAAFDATFGSGFAARELEPALQGKRPLPPTHIGGPQPQTIGSFTFTAELLLFAQTALSWLGA